MKNIINILKLAICNYTTTYIEKVNKLRSPMGFIKPTDHRHTDQRPFTHRQIDHRPNNKIIPKRLDDREIFILQNTKAAGKMKN